jgi:hypothetical protein
MTFRQATILTSIAGVTLAFSAPALAAKAKGPVDVVLRGCPYKGVPEFCTMMKGPNGKVYNVTSAVPPAPVGTIVIILRGVAAGEVSPCGGTVLQGIAWQPTRMLCPKPKT